jgi:hypothetical protein
LVDRELVKLELVWIELVQIWVAQRFTAALAAGVKRPPLGEIRPTPVKSMFRQQAWKEIQSYGTSL